MSNLKLSLSFALIGMILSSCDSVESHRSDAKTEKQSTADAKGKESEATPAVQKKTLDSEAADILFLCDALDNGEDPEMKKTAANKTDAIPPMPIEIVDESRASRLAQLVMTKLDSDKSNDLTLAEFLSAPILEKVEEEDVVLPVGSANAVPPIVDEFKDRRTELFNKFAGDDKKLSLSELGLLVKDAASFVHQLRMLHFRDNQPQRILETIEGFVERYDLDHDGNLDKDEISKMKDDVAHRFECDHKVDAVILPARTGEKEMHDMPAKIEKHDKKHHIRPPRPVRPVPMPFPVPPSNPEIPVPAPAPIDPPTPQAPIAVPKP